MTYSYTLSSAKADTLKTTRSIKVGLAALAATLLVTAVFIAAAPKSKPTPLATQPIAAELAPFQTQTQVKQKFKIPEAMTYRGVDNAIRDFQMDNAHLGHSMKMAVISDKNPIKQFFVEVERKFSLMAVLVGLTFIFTLVSFGFIRTSKDDLSNY